MRTMLQMAVALAILAVSPAQAQQGMIRGKVTESESFSLLPDANLNLVGTSQGTVAGQDGTFELSASPGTYRLQASLTGYQSAEQSVEVIAGATVVVDFELVESAPIVEYEFVVVGSRKEKVLDAPASVAVVDEAEIRNRQALSISEHVKALPGVDQSKTGLTQSNTVIRGFNNVFSGTALVLVDNRIARVPSLRLNAPNFIPTTGEDIERIEVVLGPGAALYGPNSANGVMHIITRSPIGSEGNSISILGGEKSVRKAALRHASSYNDKIGVKISGEYFSGRDWEYVDRVEVEINEGTNPRDYDLERRGGEVRVDFWPSDELTLIATGGHTQFSGIELTGQGAAQADDFTYNFAQGRLLYKDWFAQVFHNRSDAGKTRLLRTGGSIVDESTLTVLQLQHSAKLGKRQQLTYGGDALWTRPQTGGTIHGQNEMEDDINEYGVYLQSETGLSDQVEMVLAGRVDDHNHIEGLVFSPRAALVIKPDRAHTLRATYNRAFGTPSSPNLFLDLVSRRDAFGLGQNFGASLGFEPAVDVRSQGARGGFTFRRDANGLPMFRSSFAPAAGLSKEHYLPLHDPQFTNVMWGVGRAAVLAQLVPELTQTATDVITQLMVAAGLSPDQAREQASQQAAGLAAAFPGIVPMVLPGLQNAVGKLNLRTEGFDPVMNLSNAVTDIGKIAPTITETFEIGYKGVVQNELILAADAYRTQIRDFVGPLLIETPNVFLEPTSLHAALSTAFDEALQNPANAQLAGALAALDAPALGGNGNGSAVDELATTFATNAARIPFGTITPEQASDPAAVMLTYRNYGKVVVYGADLAFAYYPDDAWTVTGNYSYVSKDLFPNLDNIGDIALNAPTQKFNLGVAYKVPNTRLSLGGEVRYRGNFPMNSGVYVGPVDSYAVVDANATYEIPMEQVRLTLSLEASNLLNQKYRSFVGAPEIGRLVSTGVGVRF